MDDFHRPAAQHVARAHHQRIADLGRQPQRVLRIACRTVGRLLQAEVLQQFLEALAVLGGVDHVRRGADDRHAVGFQRTRQFQRRLAAVLDDHAPRLLDIDHFQHVLERQRLEVQPVRRIVVGGHRFRVAVDHDGLEAGFAQAQRRMHAAVVEFDALADAVRTAAEHHHLAPRRRPGFALFLVARVHVGSTGGELGRAGVDPLVDRADAQRPAMLAHHALIDAEQRRQAAVGEALALQRAHCAGIQRVEGATGQLLFVTDQVLDLHQEPRIDAADAVHLVDRQADAEGVRDIQQPVRTRRAHFGTDGVQIGSLRVEAGQAGFQAAQCLVQRLLDRAADGHHFADRLHLRGQAVVRHRELLEGEARDLGDHVVDGRLERGRGRAAGDVVLQFVQRVADRQLGRHLGDREAGRLRRQCRRAADARVHFDHDQAAGFRLDGKLHVGTAGIDADLAQHRERRVAHDLVFLVGQRLRRGNGNRVTGMHPHRVEVLDRADDDAVVGAVAHDFHLVFFPAEHGFFDQQLVGRAGLEAAFADGQELFAVVGDAATGTAHGERRTDDGRKTELGLDFQRLVHAVGNARARALEADLLHRQLELVAVFRLVDGLDRGADQFDVELFQHAVTGQFERAVQRGLAAHGRQHGVRTFLVDDLGHHLPGDRLDIGDVGHVRVGHDRGRIRIDQDDPVAFFAQCLARLGAGIVEFARLADHDRAGADDQDALYVGTFGHGCFR